MLKTCLITFYVYSDSQVIILGVSGRGGRQCTRIRSIFDWICILCKTML